jgi:hypothetical protein
MAFTTTSTRSNHGIFTIEDTGSPQDALATHIAGLGQIGRLDFERCAVAGEVIFAVEGDLAPVSQEDEEARIWTLAYALAKLGTPTEAAEFTRCLNAICEDGDALSRQAAARHYYNEIEARGVGEILKEMGLLAMHLASLHSTWEVVETEGEEAGDSIAADRRAGWEEEDGRENIQKLFELEVEAIARMTRGRRKSACFVHDEMTDWLNDLEASGADIEELDKAFAQAEAIEQYDEGGAVIVMSSHERTVACGQVDPEITSEDLPERARYLAGELRRAYTSGVETSEIWEEIDAQIKTLYPVSGRRAEGARFYSHANRELQYFIRQCLEALLDDCREDFHMTAMRINSLYRGFYNEIRKAIDTRAISGTMKQAFAARQSGGLSVKHLIALKTAAQLQRERLQSAPLTMQARALIREIEQATEARTRFFSWAFYGTNQPANPIHSLSGQEASAVWQALKTRKEIFVNRRMSA